MSYRAIMDSVRTDAIRLGFGFVEVGCRKWWNPMRWIKGKIYFKRIYPRKVFK